jgi:hypothetical protein
VALLQSGCLAGTPDASLFVRAKIKAMRDAMALLLLACALCACSNGPGKVLIHLPDNQHLDQTEAGWWLNEVGVRKQKPGSDLGRVIHEHLKARALLVDSYSKKGKHDIFNTWQLPGKNGWIALEESIYNTSEGIDIFVTFRYPQPGVPWSEVIPRDYQRLQDNRAYENAIILESKADGGARLFLFGWGKYCTHMTLFDS